MSVHQSAISNWLIKNILTYLLTMYVGHGGVGACSVCRGMFGVCRGMFGVCRGMFGRC